MEVRRLRIGDQVNHFRSAIAVALPGAALVIFGALWLVCWLVSGFRFPVEGYGGWNAAAAIALVATGAALLASARLKRQG